MKHFKEWIPTFISIILAIIMIYSSGILSHLSLVLYIDGYFFPQPTYIENVSDSFPLGIPVIFKNIGKKDGVVEDIIIILKNNKSGKEALYTPVCEIDFKEYIQKKRKLHAENIVSPFFYPFSLSARGMEEKTIIFTQAVGETMYPYLKTVSGIYTAVIFVKTSYENRYIERCNLKIIFDKEKYNSGITSYEGRINFLYSTFKLNQFKNFVNQEILTKYLSLWLDKK